MKRYLARLLLTLPFAAMAPAMADSPRTIDVTVSPYAFSPATIQVEAGERVRLNLRSTGGAHGFHLGALGVDASIPGDGRTVIVDLTPADPGTFEIVCAGHGTSGHENARLVVTSP